jgi:hypothetical protein
MGGGEEGGAETADCSGVRHRLSDQCIAKPRKGQSDELAGASAQSWGVPWPSGGTSFGAEFVRIEVGEGE